MKHASAFTMRKATHTHGLRKTERGRGSEGERERGERERGEREGGREREGPH